MAILVWAILCVFVCVFFFRFWQMMKRLMELKKEKEDLALEVEREEELLTNTLQKKLNQVCMDHTRWKLVVPFDQT